MFGIYNLSLLLLVVTSAVICVTLFGPYTGDSARYLSLATNLASGNGFSAATQPPYYPEVFRPPMYPVFLAGLIRLGFGVYGILAVQVGLYLLSVGITRKIALTITGNRLSADLLGILLAGYLPLVRWAASITTESLCTILFCLCSWCVVRYLQQPSWGNTVALGLTVPALFLTRTPYLVLFAPIIALSVFRFRNRALFRYSAVLAIIIVLPIAGWVARNVTVMPDSFNPFGVGSGMMLWVRTVEIQEPNIPQRSAWVVQNRDVQIVHTAAEPRVQAKADERLFREAYEVIRSRWAGFLKVTLSLITFRQWVEVYDPVLPAPVLWIATATSATLLAMGYMGISLIRTSWSLALPLVGLCFSAAAIHALFATEARYTAPVRPVLYMFAAFTGAYMIEKLKQWHASKPMEPKRGALPEK